MTSRRLRARLWLEHYGLFPRSRLTFFTLYALGLDVLLLIVQQIARSVRSAYASSLTGWAIFVTLLAAALLIILMVRWLSAHALWRMRNRLIVTYVFIGVVPIILLGALAGLAAYLFAGQFATFMVASRIDAQFQRLRSENGVIARDIATGLDASQNAPSLESIGKVATNTAVWLDEKRIVAGTEAPAPTPRPRNLPSDFSGVVRDGDRLFLRATTTIETAHGKVMVVSSAPLSQGVLLTIASGLGEITLEESQTVPSTGSDETSAASLRPVLTVGTVPAPRSLFDGAVNFSTSVAVVNWANGQSANSAAIDIQTRASALYDHLFSAPGAFAAYVEALLFAALIVFGLIEVIALWIGTRLTRTVTGAVAQLYQATTHVNRGDFTHRIPITSNDQLATLANSFNSMTESIQNLVLEQKEKQRLENEITIAQEVQAQLFPRHIHQLPSLEVFGFCRPARSVSGDYYDFLSLGPERLLLAVGDVSGKGISAALLMATIHSAVRAYSVEGIPALRQLQAVGGGPAVLTRGGSVIEGAEVCPGTLLSLLNHQLFHSTPQEKYATLFLAMYDAENRCLTFSNAGHLPPLVLSTTGVVKRLEDGGTVVGLFDNINYDEASVQLRPGEIFLAYSDGVTEPENDFGEFGEQRLIELVQENRELSLERISEIVTAAVDDWIGGAEQPDDVTLVLARAR
jgi:sigma-B regulation protein RsbU (phosphoserine phosphatase)